MIAPEPIKKRIPVGGWILGLTFLCVVSLLLLPNGKQKRITLARKKLETDFRLSPSLNNVLNQVQGERVILPGKRGGFLIWYFWAPQTVTAVGSSLTSGSFLTGAVIIRAGSVPKRDFAYDSLFVVPVNDPGANAFARAFMIWGSKSDWKSRIDLWRMKYPSNPKSVITSIEFELGKVPAAMLARADASISRLRKVAGSVEDGTQVFIDPQGRRFEVKRGLEWDFQNQYEMADLANRQADR